MTSLLVHVVKGALMAVFLFKNALEKAKGLKINSKLNYLTIQLRYKTKNCLITIYSL
jgi:hypothetical protein